MLERLMNTELYKKRNGKYNPFFITKLVKNYRSQKAILRIPNKLFYENELIACGKNTIIDLFREKPIIFHDVQGRESKIPGSHR